MLSGRNASNVSSEIAPLILAKPSELSVKRQVDTLRCVNRRVFRGRYHKNRCPFLQMAHDTRTKEWMTERRTQEALGSPLTKRFNLIVRQTGCHHRP